MTGTSARENLADVREFVSRKLREKRTARGEWSNAVMLVVDVGAGQGTYADALEGMEGVRLEAVEAWKTSAGRLRADPRYAIVYEKDIREAGGPGLYRGVDLVIFGDVLEHLSIHDAHVVWDKAMHDARYVLASVPNKPYPQGAIDGNHLEEHLILDPVTELIPFLPEPEEVWTYPVTNTYVWARNG